jgi:DNA repair protein RecO (recombination protein O)
LIIWKDKAIVLSKINYSENSLILKAFTLNNGIKTGLVKGGKKLNKSNIFEAGNLVTLEWKGRNEDVLGIFNCDLLEANSAIYLNDSKKFMSIISMLNLIEFSFLENESENELFLSTYELIKLILNNEENWLEVYVKWELLLLKKIGFGLELSTCIVSNTQKNLVYVSPKSGCAVSKAAAKGYEKKLLPLPSFLVSKKKPSLKNIKEGLELTTFF